MIELDRRHVLAIVGAGLMAPDQAFAVDFPSREIAQHLAQAQQDGKVYGLHTLLVSQGGKTASASDSAVQFCRHSERSNRQSHTRSTPPTDAAKVLVLRVVSRREGSV